MSSSQIQNPRGIIFEKKFTTKMTDFDISKFNPSLFERVKKVENPDCLLKAEDLLDEESEVWILQCPNNMDLSEILQGQRLLLKGETLIEDSTGSKTYKATALPQMIQHDDEPDSEHSVMTLVPGREDNIMKLVAAPIKGVVLIKETIEEEPLPLPPIKPKLVHKIPADVKVRHPIYGTSLSATDGRTMRTEVSEAAKKRAEKEAKRAEKAEKKRKKAEELEKARAEEELEKSRAEEELEKQKRRAKKEAKKAEKEKKKQQEELQEEQEIKIEILEEEETTTDISEKKSKKRKKDRKSVSDSQVIPNKRTKIEV